MAIQEQLAPALTGEPSPEASPPRPTKPVAVCPLCSESFVLPAQYKSHLSVVHHLLDDPGTDTELELTAPPPPPPPDPEPVVRSKAEERAKAKADAKEAKQAADALKASQAKEAKQAAQAQREAQAKEAKQAAHAQRATHAKEAVSATRADLAHRASEAKAAALSLIERARSVRSTMAGLRVPELKRAPRQPRSQSLRATAALRLGQLRSSLRMPRVTAGGQYLLAARFGDIALYAPGALLILAGALGGRSDAVSLTMAIIGSLLVLTGMLLPLLHRWFPPADEAQPPAADSATRSLEEALLSLPPKG